MVDSTFGPPGLQDPFLGGGGRGADVVMHSGTKYLGGHSDLLWGVLATGREGWAEGLREERAVLGSVMGGLEGWLGVRSLRTLGVRVAGQSRGAEALVEWLAGWVEGGRGDRVGGERVVQEVKHASLQAREEGGGWVREQMPGGYGPVFAVVMGKEEWARGLPGRLRLFQHATSLGGVESLVEWRAMSDPGCDRRVVRVSVGLEWWEDLRDDLERGLRGMVEEEERGGVKEEEGGGVEEEEKRGGEEGEKEAREEKEKGAEGDEEKGSVE